MKVLILSLLFLACVNGHGYLSNPPSRNYLCYKQDHFYYPEDGSAIPNYMCRKSYEYVMNKVADETGNLGLGITEAQSMYTQLNEYAFLLGPNYEDRTLLRKLMPAYLCSAGAHQYNEVFGDKSGVSIYGPWQKGMIFKLKGPDVQSIVYTMEFCPTAAHDPSYFEIYFSNQSYNPLIEELSWDHLILSQRIDGAELSETKDKESCSAGRTYKLPVLIPVRENLVIFVRWQRKDLAGEGFYQCADVGFEYLKNIVREDHCHGNRTK